MFNFAKQSPWDYFLETEDGEKASDVLEASFSAERRIRDSEWMWLKAVLQLKSSAAVLNGEVSLEDTEADTVTLRLYLTNEFTLKVSPTKNFPKEEPIVECSYQSGFAFVWTESDDALAALLTSYITFARKLDSAITMLQACEGFEFKLGKIRIDDEQTDCIGAQIFLEGSEEVIQPRVVVIL